MFLLHRFRLVVPFAFCAFPLLVVAGGCADDDNSGGSGPDGGGGAGGAAPEECDGHAVEGLPTFADRTTEWGLTDVAGGRVMSGDVNGDGYPDLFVHGFTPNAREEVGGDKRTYLLINEASGSGRTFVDRTYDSGFAVPADGSTDELKSSHFVVLGDVDNDGDLDAFSGTYSNEPAGDPETPAELDRSEIYLNDGAGNFTLLAGSGVAFVEPLPSSSATFVDADRDGNLDLFVGVHYIEGVMQSPVLFAGHGDGTFTDVSLDREVNKEKRATFGVTSCDLDDDGLPELLMSAYARGPDVLFHSTPDGYEDLGEASGFAFDANQDYHDNQNFLCWCTVNPSNEECASAAAPGIVCPDPPGANWSMVSETKPNRLGGNTFTTACRDIDGDGKQDIYRAEIAHWWAGQSSDKPNALINGSTGPGSFQFTELDRAAAGVEVPHVGVDWNEGGIVAALVDVDGDARTDIVLGTSDYADQYAWVFRQKEDGTFEETGESLGVHHPCAVGVTAADFDRDGDLDIVVASGTARDCAEIWTTNEVHIYENAGEANNGWLAVRLRGASPGTNGAAIGAKVVVQAGGVSQVQELTSGYGHFGLQNDTVLFYALGSCARAAEIEVTWPDASRSTSTFSDVPGGRLVELRQGEDEVYEILPGGGE